MARKLKTSLDLNTDRALRGVKNVNQELDNVGTKAGQAGDTGESAFGKMAGGVGGVQSAIAGLAGAMGIGLLMGKIDELRRKWLDSYKAMADASRMEGERMRSEGAVVLADQPMF